MPKPKKHDHVVCIDEHLPVKGESILRLGKVYKVLDMQEFPSLGTLVLRVQCVDSKKMDWFHADRFTVLGSEAS